MKTKRRAAAMTMISGNDGPTSVFIASLPKERQLTWKEKYRKKRFCQKRAGIIARLAAEPHTLEELIAYIENNYHARELASDSPGFHDNMVSLKAALIGQYSPDLAGPPLAGPPFSGPPLEGLQPAEITQQALEEYMALISERTEKIAQIPDQVFPMDYHLYIIDIPGSGQITINMEKIHPVLTVGYSFSGGKKVQKEFERITKDIYLYYGVTREDILNQSPRFEMLVTVLSGRH